MAGHDPEPQAQIPTLRQLSGEAQAGLHQARFPEALWEGRGRELFLAEAGVLSLQAHLARRRAAPSPTDHAVVGARVWPPSLFPRDAPRGQMAQTRPQAARRPQLWSTGDGLSGALGVLG